MKVRKSRIDTLLVERDLVPSREKGRRMIMAGEVLVDDQPVTKPGAQVDTDCIIRLKEKPRYVSRGGEKLESALGGFNIDPTRWICADVGASTGGFTDCLLQHGASRVYAIDVGRGQLAWVLQQDPRVVMMDRTNARHLINMPEQLDLIVVDASFISLELLLPNFSGWAKQTGSVVALVKPQFEAGRQNVGKGGVVKDSTVHTAVLKHILLVSQENGWVPQGLLPSPLRGPAGNVEFLLWLKLERSQAELDLERLVDDAVTSAHQIST